MTINSAFLLGKISRMDSLICRRRLTDLQTNPEHFLFHETKFGLHNLAAGISQTQIVLSAMTGRVTCLLFRLFLTNLAGFFSRQPGRILGQNPGFFSKSCPKNKSCRPAGPRSPGVRNSCRDILVIPAGFSCRAAGKKVLPDLRYSNSSTKKTQSIGHLVESLPSLMCFQFSLISL